MKKNLAILALIPVFSVAACGSKSDAEKNVEDMASALDSISAQQTALPSCADITAPGKPVDASAVSQEASNKNGGWGVCTTTPGKVDGAIGFFWTNKCKDGRTFVYSKENHAMGYDGDTWQRATDAQIDKEQLDKCVGI